MSLISIYDDRITNPINVGKVLPADVCIEQCVILSRHLDNCSDLMQRDSLTEDILFRKGGGKRGRRNSKPILPVKEWVEVVPTNMKGRIEFSCGHYHMLAGHRYSSVRLRLFR
jgi:hypothetical protein